MSRALIFEFCSLIGSANRMHVNSMQTTVLWNANNASGIQLAVLGSTVHAT